MNVTDTATQTMITDTLPLRPYQVEAIDAIHRAETRGVRRQVVALPTGTGKTVIFSHLIARRASRSLVVAHRDELIEQAAAKIRAVDPRATIGICKAERDEWQAPVTVASIQTIARNHRLTRIPRNSYQVIIVDECHHAAADSYMATLDYFGAFRDDGPLTIGFSATPERADDRQLADAFDEIVYRRDIESMIADGYLCDLRAVQVKVNALLDRVHTVGGDLVAGELAEALAAANAPGQAVAAWVEHARDRKTLVFTPTVALAEAMADKFRDAGVRAESLSGETPLDERRAILRRLSAGETQVVSNCAVLTEGFDEPTIDCIVVARPTKSRPLYIQMIGRGTRIHPAKSDCLILDLVGVTSRHEIVTASTLFNVDAHTMSESGLREAITERDNPQASRHDVGPEEGELVAREVQLFGRRTASWSEGSDGRWSMRVAGAWVTLEPAGQGYRVIVARRYQSPRILATDLPLGYAQGVAEDHARSLLQAVFDDPNAAWRRKPATADQLKTLARFRVRAPAGLTCGQASDLIKRAIGRRRSA